MTTEYKGFTIHKLTNNFHVAAAGFNPKGYATLNNAKGAITKHLNAAAIVKEVEGSPGVKVKVTNGLREDSIVKHVPKAALGYTLDRMSYTDLSSTIKQDADRTTALLRYHGLVRLDGVPRNRDNRSRNQREGYYAGKVVGRHRRWMSCVLYKAA